MHSSYIYAFCISLISGLMIISQKWIISHNVSFHMVMALSIIFSTLCGLAFLLYYKDIILNEYKDVHLSAVHQIFWQAFIGTFILGILGYKLVEENNAYIASGLTLSAPLFTVLFAYLFLNEQIMLKGVFGIIIILIGSWLIILDKMEQDKNIK
jgi:drug/metabolite transporter (DMT)-like permease